MSKASEREQIADLRAERDSYLEALRRLVPGFKKKPDAGWQAMIRIRRHIDELAWMSEPGRAAVYDSSTGGGGERSIYPGIAVASDGATAELPDGDGVTNKGNRNLYHPGQAFGKQVERVVNGMNRLVDRSEDWVKGIDQETAELPRNRRPRCRHCGGELGLVWRYCATCGRPVVIEVEAG